MALLTVPVRITYPGSGGPGFNIWHARTTGDFTPPFTDLQGLIDILHTFYSAIANCYTPFTTVAYEGVATTVEENPQFSTDADAWSVTGSDTSNSMLPVAAQICVGWTTTEAGRRGRGRTFIGPVGQGCLDAGGDGSVSTARLSSLSTAALALVASSGSFANGAWGVYSPTFGVFNDFTGMRIRDTFAVLTSRRD